MDNIERKVWVVALFFTLIAGMAVGVALTDHYGPVCEGTRP